MLRDFIVILLLMNVILAKPIDESINEIDHGNHQSYKASPEVADTEKVPSLSTLKNESKNSDVKISQPADNVGSQAPETTTKSNPFAWFLSPIAQKIQLSPQTFFQDRLNQLRETLDKLGINVQGNFTGKQLSSFGNSLLHVVGPNDTGFYTNRLEPAGFFGGNGWFANKGGILGGPGAILSTGSLLTDYPTAYKR